MEKQARLAWKEYERLAWLQWDASLAGAQFLDDVANERVDRILVLSHWKARGEEESELLGAICVMRGAKLVRVASGHAYVRYGWGKAGWVVRVNGNDVALVERHPEDVVDKPSRSRHGYSDDFVQVDLARNRARKVAEDHLRDALVQSWRKVTIEYRKGRALSRLQADSAERYGAVVALDQARQRVRDAESVLAEIDARLDAQADDLAILKPPADPLPDDFFLRLNDAEAEKFRQWARDNYATLNRATMGLYHPVVRAEIARLDAAPAERAPSNCGYTNCGHPECTPAERPEIHVSTTEEGITVVDPESLVKHPDVRAQYDAAEKMVRPETNKA